MKVLDINETTRIPISWIFILLGFGVPILAGGIFWLSTLYSVATDAQTRVMKMETSTDNVGSTLHSIDKRLSRIEDRIGIKQ